MKAKNIPNILSVLRILMVPLFVLLYVLQYSIAALAVFVLAGASDVADGMLARRYGWVTDTGKFLDPFADKLMQCVVLVCLYVSGIIPWWMLAVCMAKEAMMIIGALFIFRRKKVVVVSGWCGKIAVCVFYAAVFSMIVFPGMPAALKTFICVVTVVAALFAICKYYTDYLRKKSVRKSMKLSDVGETIK